MIFEAFLYFFFHILLLIISMFNFFVLQMTLKNKEYINSNKYRTFRKFCSISSKCHRFIFSFLTEQKPLGCPYTLCLSDLLSRKRVLG